MAGEGSRLGRGVFGQVWGPQAGCRRGVRVGGGPRQSSGLELRRFTLFWRCWLRFGGRAWGLGAPRRSPQLRESVLGRREAVPLGRLHWEILDHFAARRFSYRCPGPSLGSPLSQCLSAGLPGRSRSVSHLPSRPLGPRVQRGTARVARRSGCRLTGMSQTMREREGCVWGSGIWDFGPTGRIGGTSDPLLGPFSSSGSR